MNYIALDNHKKQNKTSRYCNTYCRLPEFVISAGHLHSYSYNFYFLRLVENLKKKIKKSFFGFLEQTYWLDVINNLRVYCIIYVTHDTNVHYILRNEKK